MLVLILHLPSVFICRNNVVGTHIFFKLVFSARLYMKMASWGFCVFVFDSSGETANCPEEMACGVLCSSRTEFAGGRSASEEEAVGASTAAPMKIPSKLYHDCALCWQIRDHLLCFVLSQMQLVTFHVSPELAMCRQKQN